MSHKTYMKGIQGGPSDVRVLLETKQPLCSKVYLGNMVDQRAICDFMEEFDIKEEIIVADKGFLPRP